MQFNRLIFVVLSASLWCQDANAQMHFWLSTSSDVSASSEVGETPNIAIPNSGLGEIYVWAKPEDNKTLEAFSLNLVSSSETAIEFTSAEVINGGRFSSVFDTNNGLNLADQNLCVFPAPAIGIWGLSGLSVDPDSGTGLDASLSDEDARFNRNTESWHVATIGYRAVVNGSTDLFLEVGNIGMNYEGEAARDMSVLFGDSDDIPLGNAFEDRCVSSVESDAQVTVINPILGDFNFDGLLDAVDIDLLSAEANAGTNDGFYDLNLDGLVNSEDRIVWVEDLKDTNLGDVDLNGVVDFTDFLRLSVFYGQSLGWADGDVDGSFLIEFKDFLVLSVNYGAGAPAAAEAVPEPNGAVLLIFGAAVLLLCRRRR